MNDTYRTGAEGQEDARTMVSVIGPSTLSRSEGLSTMAELMLSRVDFATPAYVHGLGVVFAEHAQSRGWIK
jgi:hypothetical protein